MSWRVESSQACVKVTDTFNDGRQFRANYPSKEWTREPSRKKSGNVVDTKVEPYTLEVLTCPIELRYPQTGILLHELVVGVKDQRSIAFISIAYTRDNFPVRQGEEYGFDNDQPAGYVWGYGMSPNWPTNHPAIIDSRLTPFFEELKKKQPSLGDSLDRCVAQLEVPGPSFAPRQNFLELTLP